MKLGAFLIAFSLGVGLLLAQGPGRGLRAGKGPVADGVPGGFLDGPRVEQRLTRALNLNAEQQNRLHTILQEQEVMTKGMPEKVQELRKQLTTAIRANNESQIDQITRDLSQLNQQRMALSAKSMGKLYNSLDASQKGILDRNLDREFRQVPMRMKGKGRVAAPAAQ